MCQPIGARAAPGHASRWETATGRGTISASEPPVGFDTAGEVIGDLRAPVRGLWEAVR
jgi:hypothetical protein